MQGGVLLRVKFRIEGGFEDRVGGLDRLEVAVFRVHEECGGRGECGYQGSLEDPGGEGGHFEGAGCVGMVTMMMLTGLKMEVLFWIVDFDLRFTRNLLLRSLEVLLD